MYNKLFILIGFLTVSIYGEAQNVINFDNPSFEGAARNGSVPDGWIDCGFEDETPPDIHPSIAGGEFGVINKAFSGKTYVGLVVRDNNTWEAIGQKIPASLKKRNCYSVNLYLSSSTAYESISRISSEFVNYSTPIKLRIWGSKSSCQKEELLEESPIINHSAWKQYSFSFQPQNDDYDYIILEAYFNLKNSTAYNGNILVDNISPITLQNCSEFDSTRIQYLKNVSSIDGLQVIDKKKGIKDDPLVIYSASPDYKTEIIIDLTSQHDIKDVKRKILVNMTEQDLKARKNLIFYLMIYKKSDKKYCKSLLKEALVELGVPKGNYEISMVRN